MRPIPMIGKDLANLNAVFDELGLEPGERARIQTLFYKRLSELAHARYGGVMQTVPRCSLPSMDWLNVWYTPGVSRVSTEIRADNERSFELSSRGSTVAVVSDSTRVLGDGDCTPPGGMGVMEGKAFLMKYLGGIDAVPLCIDSRNQEGKHESAKIIDFVHMVQHSFGAVNLEDISQPECFFALDGLRDSSVIPVWHDDAQGTASVTLAGLYNALELAGKRLDDAKIVLLGAGAANTTIARLLLLEGADPKRLILADRHGTLHAGRADLRDDPMAYRQWGLAQSTNLARAQSMDEAMRGADVLIALSSPGPGVVKPLWVRSMASKAIVFACANPVPEIWPHEAKEAGAFIVATGRGDFPNQVNNSVCFPGILKGALLVRAKTITDSMAIRCAQSIAAFAREEGISPDYIIPGMERPELFAREAADVAAQAIKEGVARLTPSWQEVYDQALADIAKSQRQFRMLESSGFIEAVPDTLIQEAFSWALQGENT